MERGPSNNLNIYSQIVEKYDCLTSCNLYQKQVFEPYLTEEAISDGLKKGQLIQVHVYVYLTGCGSISIKTVNSYFR